MIGVCRMWSILNGCARGVSRWILGTTYPKGLLKPKVHCQSCPPPQEVSQSPSKAAVLLTVCVSLFFFFSPGPLCSFTHDIPKQLSKTRDILSVTHEKTAVMDSLNAFIAFWTLESPGHCHKSTW